MKDKEYRNILRGYIIEWIASGYSRLDILKRLRTFRFSDEVKAYIATLDNDKLKALYASVVKECGEDENIKGILFERYSKLYQAMLAGEKPNLIGAKTVLDSLVKLTGASEPEKHEISLNDIVIEIV